MMNDPIKNFVKEHRDEFDDLVPSASVFDQIQQKLDLKTQPNKKVRIYPLVKWLVAAVLLVGFGLFLYDNSQKENPMQQNVVTVSENPKAVVPERMENTIEEKHVGQKLVIQEPIKIKRVKKQDLYQLENQMENPEDNHQEIQILITNETSASSRIQGLQTVNKQAFLDDQLLATIVEIATADENSNVRLAAMDVLVARMHQPKIVQLLGQTFVHQDDPIVQTELIDLLGSARYPEIHDEVKEKLIALTEDPQTVAYVKDRAYAVLMKNE